MMIYVTESVNNNRIALNTNSIIAVYKIPDGENQGKTCVTLSSGHIFAEEEDYEIVALINNGE